MGAHSRTVTHWSQQVSLRGLTLAPRVLALQVKRFLVRDLRVCKTYQPILAEGDIRVPILTDQGLSVHETCYRVRAVIMHRGPEVQSGHYKAFLSLGEGRWMDTDDNRRGQLAHDTRSSQSSGKMHTCLCARAKAVLGTPQCHFRRSLRFVVASM